MGVDVALDQRIYSSSARWGDGENKGWLRISLVSGANSRTVATY
jgi:hypothetical protein